MEAKVIEMVTMKVKEGVSDADFLQAAKNIDETISKFPGFVYRELGKDGNGNWVDIVYWTELAFAQKAAEEVMKSPTCHVFFGMIDEKTMHMQHFDVIHQVSR